jgi:hypothetical protein
LPAWRTSSPASSSSRSENPSFAARECSPLHPSGDSLEHLQPPDPTLLTLAGSLAAL